MAAGFDEVCFALEVACLSKGDGIAFALENYRLEGATLQEKFHSHLIERSECHKDHADLLMTIFRNPNRQVRRRIQLSKRFG